MFKSRRTIAMVLALIVSMGLSVYGTLAYLSDHEQVVNTFTVGMVDITLDETDVDINGQPTGEPERVESNEYHLLPGHSYVKDPTVTVSAGSEESYIRATVTLNKLSEITAISCLGGSDFLPENFVTGWDRTIWIPTAVTKDEAANTVTYEFRYYKTVDAKEAAEDIVLEPLFQTIEIPGEITGDELATLSELEVVVNAHAIQAHSFADADEAWAAFDAQVPATVSAPPADEPVNP
jgi:predicted ribosomally synthesized peptide with SipW-like signal peptide